MRRILAGWVLGFVVFSTTFGMSAEITVPATAPTGMPQVKLGVIPTHKTPPPQPRSYQPVNMDRENIDWYGNYLFVGRNDKPMETKKAYPYIKGAFVNYKWSDLEPRQGEFNWKLFDERMVPCAKAGLYIQFIVNVGPDSPKWIYEKGVPVVKTTPTTNPKGQPHWTEFPYYLDPNYKQFYYTMLRQVAAHIDTFPPDVRSRIISVVTAEGTTGDEGPYKGIALEEKYRMDEKSPNWRAFKYETFKFFEELYGSKTPPIHITINSGNAGQYHDWIMQNMPDTWRKAGNPGHGYQLNDEMSMVAFLDPIINYPNANGRIIRARSEMDETHKGWFAQNPLWNQYWLNVWLAHFGMDMEQNYTSAYQPQHEEGFLFYGKYAGQKDPATSPGAFCALRDGLDALDYDRFPKAQFGEAKYDPNAKELTAQNARCLAIAKAFEKFGARQEDPEHGNRGTMANREATRMNDVGWNIWDSNYQRYLTQYDPNGTSIGWWRVGPPDQPYGRFGRGFDAANGKKAMCFDLNDHFHEGQNGGTHAAELRVVYFDKGAGKWSLCYDAIDDPQKVAFTVENTDSGRWIEKKITVTDARLQNGGENRADLELRWEAGDDTIFHMLELTRMN